MGTIAEMATGEQPMSDVKKIIIKKTLTVPTLVHTGGELDEAIANATHSPFTVDDDAAFSVGDFILIESEAMKVTNVDAANSNISATRGVLGTTAASHNDNTAIHFLLPVYHPEAGDYVTGGFVQILTGFDGSTPVITMGDFADPDGYVTAANVTEATPGVYYGTGALLGTGGKLYTAGTANDLIFVDYVSAAAGTTGELRVGLVVEKWRIN